MKHRSSAAVHVTKPAINNVRGCYARSSCTHRLIRRILKQQATQCCTAVDASKAGVRRRAVRPVPDKSIAVVRWSYGGCARPV
jgi:hypothetical protein